MSAESSGSHGSGSGGAGGNGGSGGRGATQTWGEWYDEWRAWLLDALVDVGVAALLIGAVAAAIWWRDDIFPTGQLLDRHLFWVLAMIPSVLAIANYLVAERRRYRRGQEDIETRKTELIAQKQADAKAKGATPAVQGQAKESAQAEAKQDPVVAKLEASLEDDLRKPRFAYTMLGAMLLAVVFGISAQLSTRPEQGGLAPESYGIGPAFEDSSAAAPVQQPEPAPAAPPAPAPEPDGADAPEAPPAKGMDEAIRATVFASYGAYAFALRSMVGRLNAQALTNRFVVRLALQSAGSLILGFVIGYVGAISVAASKFQSLFVYFLLGMFPAWAAQILAARAREIFVAREAGCEKLPLCLIDGIDDDVADRLSEENIWDVQHLATSCPSDLRLRTQYSLDRILDWIDQAILISYVRDDIAPFRTLGIRGAIDLAVLSAGCISQCRAEASKPPPPGTEQRHDRPTQETVELRSKAAAEVFQLIPQLTKQKRPELLAQTLFEDATVDRVWTLWQRHRS